MKAEFYNDPFSDKLIKLYNDHKIFCKEQDVLDKAINKYVIDYNFSKQLKKKIKIKEVLSEGFCQQNELLEFIVYFFKNYKEEPIKSQSRWI